MGFYACLSLVINHWPAPGVAALLSGPAAPAVAAVTLTAASSLITLGAASELVGTGLEFAGGDARAAAAEGLNRQIISKKSVAANVSGRILGDAADRIPLPRYC